MTGAGDQNRNERESLEDGISRIFEQVTDAFARGGPGEQETAPAPVPEVAAFFKAVRANRLEEVKAFIAAGLSPDAADRYGDTALHLAARTNRPDIVRLLLDAGANPKIGHGPDQRRTPLADAVNFGNAEIAELLASRGGYVPGHAEPDGSTLLHRACEKGDPRIVEMLLRAGADANAPAGAGGTPLLRAITIGHEAAAEKLLDSLEAAAGAGLFFWHADALKRTAFHMAVERRLGRLVSKMAAAGADVNAPDGQGIPPLRRAVLAGDIRLARILLEAGADTDKPEAREPLLQAACRAPEIASDEDRAALVELLLRHGADPDRPAAETMAGALHAAALGAAGAKTLKTLLAYAADMEAADKDGFTPLFYALRGLDLEKLRLLLDAGANPNARRAKDGSTPLIAAVRLKRPAGMIALLLNAGADPELRDLQHKSALSYAREHELGDVAAQLERALREKRSAREKERPRERRP